MPRFDPAMPLVHPLPDWSTARPRPMVEVPGGHHAFDVLDDDDASRAAIRRVLDFLREHLAA